MTLSIIIPVLNEAESLAQLHQEICRMADEHELTIEVIFVDDGSTDDSWTAIEQLAEQDERVSGIRFRRNFGKAAALTAAMRAATGQNMLMMDADLQDDPAEIPSFLSQLQSGSDVVNGWKQNRLDPWHKVYPSKVFNWMVSFLTGLKLHDHNCGLKMFRAEVASEIRIYGELHRFIAVLAHARGFKVCEIPVNHRRRQFGQSKYGVRRFFRGLLDLLTVKFLTGFGQRPQHMLGGFGIFFFVVGLCGLGFLAGLWVVLKLSGVDPQIGHDHAPMLAYSVASTLLGAQAITLGLLAELIVAYTGRESETYSIAARTGSPTKDHESAGV